MPIVPFKKQHSPVASLILNILPKIHPFSLIIRHLSKYIFLFFQKITLKREQNPYKQNIFQPKKGMFRAFDENIVFVENQDFGESVVFG